MTIWQRWFRQPQRIWLRRAIFQIHLWTGLALGLYVVMLSITGSALVYRNDLDRAFATPRPVFEPKRPQLTKDEMTDAVLRAYPGYTVTSMGERVTRRNPTIGVSLEKGSEKKDRLFNPYTGEDLGESITKGELFVLWLARLHDELLLESEGRFWNGIASLVFTLSVLAGAVVWWPGVSRWRRSLMVKRGTGWRRFNWDLHSAGGLWLFLFMLMWGVSGFYLGVPQPFSALVDYISEPDVIERPGDVVLSWLTQLHFGRFRGVPYSRVLNVIWAVVGLVPAMMFVTGLIMWWNRVIRRRPSREVEEAVEEAVA